MGTAGQVDFCPRLLSSTIGMFVIRGLGEEHVIPTTAYSATTSSSTVQVDEIL
jgi:hypothetical protein